MPTVLSPDIIGQVPRTELRRGNVSAAGWLLGVPHPLKVPALRRAPAVARALRVRQALREVGRAMFGLGWRLAAAGVAALLLCCILTPLTHPFREAGYGWFLHQRSGFLSPLMDRATLVADPPWILPVGIGITAGVAASRRHVVPFVAAVLALPLCRALQDADRLVYHSGAPPQLLAIGAVGGSPSGGTLRVVVFWGIAAWALWHVLPHRRPVGRAVMTVLVLVCLGEGYTRMYLGRHWLVDVISGYLVGAVLLAGFLRAEHQTRRLLFPMRRGSWGSPGTAPEAARLRWVALAAIAVSFLVSFVLAVIVLEMPAPAAAVAAVTSALVAAVVCIFGFEENPKEVSSGVVVP